MAIAHPYLLFLADAPDQLAAKTAQGIVHWRPDWCLGQLRLPGCKADLGIPDITVEAAAQAGAKTMIVGVANRGGTVGGAWLATLMEALDRGLDLASGLHRRLSAIPELRDRASALGRQLFDARQPTRSSPISSRARSNGWRRPTSPTIGT